MTHADDTQQPSSFRKLHTPTQLDDMAADDPFRFDAITERGIDPGPATLCHRTTPVLDEAIVELLAAVEAQMAAASAVERWQRRKPAAKTDAIRRIMQHPNSLNDKPHSPSSAEAIVETDELYDAYLIDGQTLVLARMAADVAVKVAGIRCAYWVRVESPQLASTDDDLVY